MSNQKPLFDPDFCEHRCPVCTKARKGNRFAQFLQAIETRRYLWRLSVGSGETEEIRRETERILANR